MKATTLYQPYATAIMLGYKKIETRSWLTHYRGRIAIHSAARIPPWVREFIEKERMQGRCLQELPLGAIVGFVTLTDVRMTEEVADEISDLEKRYGDYTTGRWAWMLSDITPLKRSIPTKGARMIWEWAGVEPCSICGDTVGVCECI